MIYRFIVHNGPLFGIYALLTWVPAFLVFAMISIRTYLACGPIAGARRAASDRSRK